MASSLGKMSTISVHRLISRFQAFDPALLEKGHEGEGALPGF